jgi:uncharacterized iron-regulated membrane protein
MKEGFRKSMAWLHTWVGLLLGSVLYFMFITGTAGYLDTEIDRWMNPELPASRLPVPVDQAARTALDYLDTHARGAERWVISLPLNRNDPFLRVSWSGAEGVGRVAKDYRLLDPATGEAFAGRDTAGGQTLYRMHWQLHYLPRWMSDWLVGCATMFMLIALVTGVVVHKKIFTDFFTFRPGKGQRSWLDAHNAVSVFSLPFQLMITYSGLIFMMFIYMPLIVAAWYGPGEESRKRFQGEVFDTPALPAASGAAAPLVELDRVMSEARRRNDAPIASIEVTHPGDSHARIVVRGDFAAGPLRAAHQLVFDGVSGELLAERQARSSDAKAFRDVMLGLHEGLFAGPGLRAMYVLSGLLGAAMIATGLVLWTVKRRQRIEKAGMLPHRGLRAVERLNVATIIGLPIAICAYFWANRLLPLDMSDRAAWEVHALFLGWSLLFLHASLRPTANVWQEQAWLAALSYALLPLVNALTTSRHLGHSLPEGDWVMAGFDLSMLTLGLAFAGLALYLRRRSRRFRAVSMSSVRPETQAGDA